LEEHLVRKTAIRVFSAVTSSSKDKRLCRPISTPPDLTAQLPGAPLTSAASEQSLQHPKHQLQQMLRVSK